MAPFALRFVLARVTPEAQEVTRLRREELAAGSLVAGIRRVLLPVRYRGNGRAVRTIEAHVLAKLGGQAKLSVTLLNVARPGERAQGTAFLNALVPLFSASELSKKVVESLKPAEVILDEAQKDYDLIILGASEKDASSEVLFNPMVDYLMRVSPCPTMVVKGRLAEEHWPPRRILVPTNGGLAAKRAAEMAFALAEGEGEEVFILNVVVDTRSRYHHDASDNYHQRQLGSARQIVEALRELGESQGVATRAEVRGGREPEAVILQLALEQSIDLIVLGTDLRPGSERLFLGPRVERILDRAPCPVVVLNAS